MKDEKAIVKKEKAQEVAIRRRPAVTHMPNVNDLMMLGKALAKSSMFPDCKDEFAAIAKIEYGRELGLMPVISLQTIHVIKGRLGIESKALLALAKENGIKVEVLQKDKKGCKLKFSRGGESHTDSFMEEDAKRANLLYKDNYKMYPEEMYLWRCVAKGLRFFDPGLALGLYTTEELEFFDDKTAEVKLAQKLKEVDAAETEIIKKDVVVDIELEDIKKDLKDAEVVAEEDEKVEEQIAKEAKPAKKKAKPKVKEVTPKEPPEQPEPPMEQEKIEETEDYEENLNLLSDKQKSRTWQLFNTLIDLYKRDPGDLDDKLRARLKIGKKIAIPEGLAPEVADSVINILEASIENEKRKLGV